MSVLCNRFSIQMKNMKNRTTIAILLLFFWSLNGFGQQVSETDFTVGISKTQVHQGINYWQEAKPIYLFVKGSKNWYNDEEKLSLRKEAGLNLQYANISHSTSSNAMGGFNEKTGTVISLLVNAALQARYRITDHWAVGAGPEAELLLLGYNNIDDYYTRIYIPSQPPSAGHTSEKGINRNYFKKPSYGLKISLFQGSADARTTLGLHFSYLWTQSEHSSFYASNFVRFGLSIGFKKSFDKAIPDLAD